MPAENFEKAPGAGGKAAAQAWQFRLNNWQDMGSMAAGGHYSLAKNFPKIG
jgi:hypothetical protein